METEICLAARAAARVVELEAWIEAETRLAVEWGEASAAFEERMIDLLLEADAARTELSLAEASSFAGAAAQLLAAIRDIRVSDDGERLRARSLERLAVCFLAKTGAMDARAARMLSQTRASRAAMRMGAH
jgi:hypothetical protein